MVSALLKHMKPPRTSAVSGVVDQAMMVVDEAIRVLRFTHTIFTRPGEKACLDPSQTHIDVCKYHHIYIYYTYIYIHIYT